MKFVITGSAGHTSAPLTQMLLSQGHQVTVIGRSEKNLAALSKAGATTAIGSVEGVAFLTETFKGADAVYLMVPPRFDVPDWKDYIHSVGKNYVQAVQQSGIKRIVTLSSIGAHLPEGCGPVSGLYRVEKELDALSGVAITHLRAGFFYQNFFSNIGMIKGANILGGNFGAADTELVMVHTNDIATAAAEELQKKETPGVHIRYIVSDVRTAGEVAKVLGAAVGKKDLPWVGFSDEQALGGMQQAGLPPEIAKNYVEMGAAVRTGIMAEDFHRTETPLSPTKLEAFAPEFAAAYNAA